VGLARALLGIAFALGAPGLATADVPPSELDADPPVESDADAEPVQSDADADPPVQSDADSAVQSDADSAVPSDADPPVQSDADAEPVQAHADAEPVQSDTDADAEPVDADSDPDPVSIEATTPPVAVEDVPPEEQGNAFQPIEWFVLPLVGYSSDIGFGGALLGMVQHNDGEHLPFRDRVRLITMVTTERFQYHELNWERVGLFGKPLRLESELSFGATPIGNYCGVGTGPECDRASAELDAQRLGYTPGTDEFREVVHDYYLFRRMKVTLELFLRWRPVERGPELMVQYIGAYTFPGYLGATGTYPGSLYEQHFPDGERGFSSELRLGVVHDTRDNEARPTEGYVASAFLRGAGVFLGGEWNYAGINLGGAYYQTLDRDRRVVWANRIIVDLLYGDAPSQSLATVGGFWNDVGFGGQAIGRGVRLRRYIGRIKVIAQSELRWAVAGGERAQWVLIAFGDGAWVGGDYDDWGGELRQLVGSFGASTGVYWGTSFLIRFDVGLSPFEEYDPFFYLSLTHPF